MNTLFTSEYNNGKILDRTEIRTTLDGRTNPEPQVTGVTFTRFQREKFRGNLTETKYKFEIILSRNRMYVETRTFMWCAGQGWKVVDKLFGAESAADVVSEWSAGGSLRFDGDFDVLEHQLGDLAGVLFDDACKIFGEA